MYGSSAVQEKVAAFDLFHATAGAFRNGLFRSVKKEPEI